MLVGGVINQGSKCLKGQRISRAPRATTQSKQPKKNFELKFSTKKISFPRCDSLIDLLKTAGKVFGLVVCAPVMFCVTVVSLLLDRSESTAKKVGGYCRHEIVPQASYYHEYVSSRCASTGSSIKGFVGYFVSLLDFSSYKPFSDVDRQQRVSYLGAVMIVGTLFVCGRLYTIQDTEHGKWVKLAGRQHNTTIEIQGVRGVIRDSEGRALGVSVQATSFGVHPRQIQDKAAVSAQIAEHLEMEKGEIQNILSQDKSFVWLARGLSPAISDKIEALKIKGVVAVKEFRRYYPHGEVAAPVIGRVSRDGAGQSGVEAAFDKKLAAKTATVEVRRDAKGRLVSDTDEEGAFLGNLQERGLSLFSGGPELVSTSLASTEGSNSMRNEGSDIYLSIDAYVQNILEEELQRGVNDAKAKKIIGLIMDAKTGEIVAMGQYPTYNPNQLKDVTPDQMKNYVLQDAFEPGSTFKPLVAALAFDRNLTKEDELMDCEMGHYQVGKYTVRDTHPAGVITVRQVLVRSSNIGMTKLGMRLGKDALFTSLKAYGFGSPTGIPLQGEGGGIMRDAKDWAQIDIATHSFGQGISVTALQLLQAYTAIANDGLMVKPSILKVDPEKLQGKQVLKPETARLMFDMLTGVTEDAEGTGKNARIQGVRIAGKTGTAQKPGVGRKGYDPDKVFGSFIGIVDASEIGIPRRMIMFVGVDEPGVRPRWGGIVAAPVFRRSMERVISHLLTVNKSSGMQTVRHDASSPNM